MRDECARTLRRAYLYIDGEMLSGGERTEIRQHLEACRPCFERYGLEQEVNALVARLAGCHRCPEAVRSRITALFGQRPA